MLTQTASSGGNSSTLKKLLVSRRRFLQAFGAAVAAVELLPGDLLFAQASSGASLYRLRREEDELNLLLTAIGYREQQSSGFLGRHRRTFLQPAGGVQRLIFTLPPQYFAETALKEPAALPASLSDDTLGKICLVPAGVSQIVLQPRTSSEIDLTLEALLAWQDFDLVLPDSAASRQLYELEYKDAADRPTTQVEVPWGVTLTPAKPVRPVTASGTAAPAYQWIPSSDPRAGNPARRFSELWSAALEDPSAPAAQVPLQLLSARGFERLPDRTEATPNGTTVHLRYQQNADLPDWMSQERSNGITASSLSNKDRLDLAGSFSDRFPHDSQHAIDYLLADGTLAAGSGDAPCFNAGNAIRASEMRVSSRGAALVSGGTTQWRPGCGLFGWNEAIYDGRDQEVEVIRSGWLYPFGIFALLVTRTERVFLPDSERHLVAPLIQQSFIRVPKPNAAAFSSKQLESVFQSLTITTDHTPPLDIEAAGDIPYGQRDYFIPTVGNVPFPFEHQGTDWEGKRHSASMPLVFVANLHAVDGDLSLIWEPGSKARMEAAGAPPPLWMITRYGDGLRVVDKLWNLQPGRFARYSTQMATAVPLQTGDTIQYVEWVEWARSIAPDNTGKAMNGSAMHPFEARARTLKLKLHAVSLFSQVNVFSLATYRDTRFVDAPLLDPEPTSQADVYFYNILSDPDPVRPYLYLLETSAKIAAVATGTPLNSIYYGCSLPGANPAAGVLGAIDNEVQFGQVTPTDTLGGLAAPDTHASALNRAHGILGDATFNDARWAAQPKSAAELQASLRLDYAAYRVKFRPEMDLQPFDVGRSVADLAVLRSAAANLMGFAALAPRVAGATPPPSPALGNLPAQLHLGEMFGQGAELIPGITFAEIFKAVGIDLVPQTTPQANPGASGRPLAWEFSTFGTDWILGVIGPGPDHMTLQDFLEASRETQPDPRTAIAAPMGARGSLNWETTAFNGPSNFSDVGVVFTPGEKARMILAASVEVSLGLSLGNGAVNLVPSKPKITASARMESFSLTVFSLITIDFDYVQFQVDPSGAKKFDLHIGNVTLTDSMAFLQQLETLLGGLGDGFVLDIDPRRAKASLTLRFPPQEGGSLFIGPAQIINLAISFSVTIPLLSRDALSAGFAISSREKPLTIYIPPWYGGTAYFLSEATTKGLRLLEISMEYGGVIAVGWGPARGIASLTAGVYYSLDRKASPGSVLFLATVDGLLHLTVAGFIDFKGIVKIGMGIKDGSNGRSIYGVAEVGVSVKIGFVTFSYSFSATHQDDRHDGGGVSHAASFALGAAVPAADALPAAADIGSSTLTYRGTDDAIWSSHPPLKAITDNSDREKAYVSIINAYKSRQL